MRSRVVVFASAVLVSVAAFAQNRTFVSGNGLDTNPCSLTSPCRSFTAAINAVVAGGEVVALDSAGYGPFTINKNVTVTSPSGVYAGVSVTSGDGIDVTGGNFVAIRGLTITGVAFPSGNGVNFQHGSELVLENCEISGFAQDSGILSHNSTSPAKLILRDCEIRDNATGMDVQGTMTVSVDHTRFDDDDIGAMFTNSVSAWVRDGVFDSGTNGVSALSGAEVTLENCMISKFSNGIAVTGASPTTVRVSASTLVDTTTAMSESGAGAALVSFGNNRFDGNGTDGTFNTTIALK